MKLKKNIILTLGTLLSTYSVAGDDWYAHINNRTDQPITVNVSPYYTCFYIQDFVAKTIPPNNEDQAYLQENNKLFTSCFYDGTDTTKEATLLLINHKNPITLKTYYGTYFGTNLRQIAIRSNWVTIGEYPPYILNSKNQRIDVWLDYNNDGTINLTGYCNTDAGCTE